MRPEAAFTSATLSASSVQPTSDSISRKKTFKRWKDVPISFPTPADNTTIPTVVSKSFNSDNILQRTGKAVIENATPAKSMKCVNWISGFMNSLYIACERPAPMPNGRTMPARATVADRRTLRLITATSISRPTRKRKRQRPILATRVR